MKYIYKEIIKANGDVLRGVLNAPDDFDQGKKYPLLIFFHGLLDDRNGINYMSVQESKYLTSGGVLTLRFDFSATGESDGSIFDLTLTRQIEEGFLIYELAESLPFVDSDNIFLRAHSMGSATGISLASKLNPRGLILYGPGVYFDGDHNGLLKELGEIENDPTRTDKSLDIGGLKLSTALYKDCKKYNILDLAGSYPGQVLIVRGEKDKVIRRADVEDLQKAFPNASYVEIEDTAHNFTNEEKRLYLFDQTYNFIKKTIKK